MGLTEQEWKAKLSPEQYYILREKGTEKPFSGAFVFTKDKGIILVQVVERLFLQMI